MKWNPDYIAWCNATNTVYQRIRFDARCEKCGAKAGAKCVITKWGRTKGNTLVGIHRARRAAAEERAAAEVGPPPPKYVEPSS